MTEAKTLAVQPEELALREEFLQNTKRSTKEKKEKRNKRNNRSVAAADKAVTLSHKKRSRESWLYIQTSEPLSLPVLATTKRVWSQKKFKYKQQKGFLRSSLKDKFVIDKNKAIDRLLIPQLTKRLTVWMKYFCLKFHLWRTHWVICGKM